MKNKSKIYLSLFLCLFTTNILASAVVTIKNGNDSSLNLKPADLGLPTINTSLNYGLTDQTAYTAIGGNFASTLGQARFNAIQYAVNKLSNRLNSNVKINVVVIFADLGGDNTGAILAGAVASQIVTITGGILPKTFYQIALAEKISGKNLNSGGTGFSAFDIVVIVNSEIDGNVAIGPSKFYYGFDQKPPSRNVALGNGTTESRLDIDFVTTLTHELIHGIGFSTRMDSATGQLNGVPAGYDDIYMRNLEYHGQQNPSFVNLTNSQRIAANISNINLHWTGPAVLAEIQNRQPSNNPGFRNGHATMFAPTTIKPGSSVSHFSTLFNTAGNPAFDPFDEMMEPFAESANHDIGLAAQVLEDVGWGKLNSNPNLTDIDVKVTNPNRYPLKGTNEIYSISVTNNGAQTATGIILSNFLPKNATFVSANPGNGASCDSTNVLENKIVSCSLPSLPASGNAVFTITASIDNTGMNLFAANVESLNPDSNHLNNSVTNQNISTTPAPPVLFNVENQTVKEGQLLSFQVTAVDPNGGFPILSMTGKPANAIFTDDSKGTGTFTWTPASADVGTNNMNVVATDSNQATPGSDSKPLVITVTAKPKPAVSTSNSSSGGCSINQSAKIDPLFPSMLVLFSILFLVHRKRS